MDDRMAALLDRLGTEVSPVWVDTFAAGAGNPDVAKYRRLQMIVNEHGYATVRSALENALAAEIVPKGRNAVPLLRALCVAHPSVDEL